MTYGQPFVGTVSCDISVGIYSYKNTPLNSQYCFIYPKDSGPSLLRAQGLVRELGDLGWKVEDIPDLDFSTICARHENSKQPSIHASQAHNR
jgi:hypothetical protein